MSYSLRKRTKEDVAEFITWTYEGIYSFYDNNIQEEKITAYLQSVDKDLFYSVIDDHGRLIGNCEFFDVGDAPEVVMAVGVQMKPTLTGKGGGLEFIQSIIDVGREIIGFNHLELAVVEFNERAIRVYEQAGFKRKGGFQNKIRGEEYRFIIMERDW
ncbi:GNAT family N-acetyltransferase [Rossellomorea aquimaris]|uniref:GNAT family N-acetyltransferase n=1 Tax=Rossellomorea aquimaris TaxID=189382 RepID=UPI001CD5903F|nr:GNAT family protein [Rossellomorea aquimaris]MCA1054131.1 GNAT family N-acetyltransferase [Rossellomorea aquimaris]